MEISTANDLQIGGCVFNKIDNAIPDSLTIYLVNTKTKALLNVIAQRGVRRPDVANAFSNPAVETSGFIASAPKEKLQQGDYEIVLTQSDQKTGVITCASMSHHIKIK
jgi:hypothetical protein